MTVSGITGNGTLGISLAAGTASDLAGNLAPAGGPSGTFVVDTTSPTVTIGPPSETITGNGPVSYLVTYADANFKTSTLATSITLNTTGSATGTVGISGTGLTRAVTISNISGNGTLGISLAAGTASDLAGNLAPAAGPSQTFVVNATLATQDVSNGSPDTRNMTFTGQTFGFSVQYDTSDNDNTLTGLGLRIHYNSHVLQFNGFGNVLQMGFFQEQVSHRTIRRITTATEAPTSTCRFPGRM